ncbi:MAG: glycosyltransferase [Terracidiphilus sp.]
MRHIALVIPGFLSFGGAERQVLLLAGGLVRRGWRVSVLALSGEGGPPAEEFAASGATFLSLHMRKGLADPRGWLALNRWLLREAPDVVHAHLPHAAWIARWSRLTAPVRVLIDTVHTSATGGWGRRLGYRLSRRLPDRVTAVSQAVADAYLAARMVTAPQLTVLPNGIDLDRWHPDPALRARVRAELGLRDEFLWLSAGRLVAVKDYPTLLHAMAALPPQARLAIAGAGPLEDALRRRARQLGLDSRVRFLGFTHDLPRFLQAADGFVLCSRWEGLPLALLEAAACSLPSVATGVPGTSEAVADGGTGLLVRPAGSSLALHGKMMELMRMSAEQRGELGANARQRVELCYSLSSVLDRWEALYTELLEANPSPRRTGRRT